jgi:hypothetical protein
MGATFQDRRRQKTAFGLKKSENTRRFTKPAARRMLRPCFASHLPS